MIPGEVRMKDKRGDKVSNSKKQPASSASCFNIRVRPEIYQSVPHDLLLVY
jgi:hypothetical protein